MCGKENQRTRLKFHKIQNKHYLQSKCANCEKEETRKHQKQNRDYWRKLNRENYLKKVGKLSRRSPLEMTNELRREFYQEKAYRRYNRAKQSRVNWDKELTELTTIEARKLCKMRDASTQISWHIDHIIPLRGQTVSGLHVWNNLQVIPKILNLEKGNTFLGGL